MAAGALPTLTRKPAPAKAAPAPEAPVVVPIYDPRKCAEMRGGVGLVQGDNVFHPHPRHGFVRALPKGEGYHVTPEQEENHTRQLAKQRARQVSVRQLTQAAVPETPEKVIQMARENAQALAAEQYAE